MLAPHALDIAVIISSLIASLHFTFVDILKISSSSYALVSGITNKSLRPMERWPSERVTSRSLTKLQFCILQNSRKKVLTLLLLYRTSDWLNQKNLPELQAAVYIFIRNLSIIFLSSQSLLSLKTTVILCGENWKIWSFYCLCLRLLWLVEMF